MNVIFDILRRSAKKIEKAGAKIVPLLELSKSNPSGKGIRIMG